MLDQIPELATRFSWIEIQSRKAHVSARRADINRLREDWQNLCDLVHDVELIFRLAGYEPMLEAPTEELCR